MQVTWQQESRLSSPRPAPGTGETRRNHDLPTGKSTTIEELQLRNLCNFSTLSNSQHLLLTTTGMSSECPRTANHLETCTTCTTGTSTTCTGATGETLWSAEQQDHGNRPLYRTRKSTTCEELRLRKSAVFCTATHYSFWSILAVMPSITGL